jgi:hypothetical protein
MREPLGTSSLKEGAAFGRVITVRSEPWGMKARPITDVTSTPLRKEEIAVC